jgi:hypothetical protein
MTLSAGTRLGPYEILGPIGAGGMGEVHRARDTRLGRDVAVKVLPPEASRSPDRLRRFEQEARLAGSLSHPNLLALFDVGSHEGAPYLVTELLEGRTLREALHAGPLPPRKCVEHAQQIARGLAAAHEHGIVHRDLKPANLFLTRDGHVKILDFGLAKLTQSEATGAGSEVSTDTATGRAVGTLGYMAPEQVRGLPLDSRADIFAFGAVLYEMLSGRRAFPGDTPADTMTAILTKDPDELSRPGLDVPQALERLVRRCLEKDPDERFQSAKDVAFALEAESGASRSAMAAVGGDDRGRRRRLVPLGLALAGLATGLVAGWLGPRRLGPQAPERASFVDVALPPGVQLAEPSFARLSADGRQVVFVGAERGRQRLWLRTLDSANTQPLPGTESAWPVAWTPDGRRVVFLATSGILLKTIDVATGAVETLGSLPKGPYWGDTTGTWSATGDFVVNWGPLHSFPATGGAGSVFARPEDPKTYFDAPQFLPDGRRFLTGVVGATPAESGVCVGESGRTGCRFVLRSVSWATFAPPDHLLFVRDGVLFAQPFDVEHAGTVADPTPVLDGVYVSTWRHPTTWVGGDTLLFVSGARQRHQLAWFDRTGRESGRLAEPTEVVNFELARDGTRVMADLGHGDHWLTDARERGAWTRVPGSEGRQAGVLSPDGLSALYSRAPGGGLYAARLDGGNETCVVPPPSSASGSDAAVLVFPAGWSPDGRTVLFTTSADPNAVWSVPFTGGTPQAVVRTSGNVRLPRFSPDGRWISYAADEAGRPEVFVVPYPPAEGRWQVSIAGGYQPRWRGDGREIYYLDPRGNLMAAEVTGGERFAAGRPRLLFASGIDSPSPFGPDYAAADDGSRFLLRLPAEGHRPPELKLVLGWRALLRDNPGARGAGRR